MNLTTIFAGDKMADIAKGRYSKKQVEEIFRRVATEAALDAEKTAFECAILLSCQALHYDFGFGKKRLGRFAEKVQPMLDGFDARAYGMEDIREALRQDAKFELCFVYGDEGE